MTKLTNQALPPPAAIGSATDQIRNQAPIGAHGYQIEVHAPDGRLICLPEDLPKTSRRDKPLEFWTLSPFQMPQRVPEGRHRLVYVSPEVEVLGEGILNYYPLSTAAAPAPSLPAGTTGSAPSGEVDLLKLQQEQQKIVARAQSITMADAFVKNQAGQQANLQAMSQDLADAYRTVLENSAAISAAAVAASAKLLEGYNELMEAAAKHAKRVAEALPAQPPPPQDWAGVVKEGVNVLGDLAESWGLKRKRQGRIEESGEKIEIREQLASGAEKEPVDAEATDKGAAKTEKPADKGSAKDDGGDPPSASAPVGSKAPAAPAAKPKENRQDTAKRSLRRVLVACASLQPQHVMRFLHDPPFLHRFLSHLRTMMFPVTSWRWRLA